MKRGAQVLTLSSGEVTVTGPVRVEQGRLSFKAAPPTTQCALYMAPGTEINVSNNRDPTDVLTAPVLELGAATGGNVCIWIEGDVLDGVARCDRLHIPAGGYVGRLQFRLSGTAETASGDRPFVSTGDFPVITYTDTTPQLSDLSATGLPAGYAGEFVRDAANKRILLRVTRKAVESEWAHAAGGDYETAANWTAGVPADDGAGSARFGSALKASGVVTLAHAHALLDLAFANAAASYTLDGGALALGDPSGATEGTLAVSAGAHTIAAPLALRGPVTGTRSSGTQLTLAGGLTGDAPLTLQGVGTTRLAAPDGAADFAGGVVLAAGTLEVASANGLGTTPLTLKTGTSLRWLPESPATLSGQLTLSQTSTCEIVSADAALTLGGRFSFEDSGLLRKRGGRHAAVHGRQRRGGR